MVEKINPSGNVAVQAVNPPNPSANAFGAGIAQATQRTGRVIQASGDRMLAQGVADIQKQRDREQAAHVMEGITESSGQIRDFLYNPDTGIYSRKGGDARDSFEASQKFLLDTRNNGRKRFQTPEEQLAYDAKMRARAEAVLNSVAQHELRESGKYTQEQKISGLANIYADADANANDPDSLSVLLDEGRAVVRSNPDGLSSKGIDRLEREFVSSFHVAVIQKKAIDSPGDAAEYYLKNKKEVSGADHAAVDNFVKSIFRAQNIKKAVGEAFSSGSPNLRDAVIGAESSGNPNAVSPKGALGLMQVMPDTAREVAVSLGLPKVAGMDDEEMKAFFRTPEGQNVNKRIGTSYLNTQLKTFNGDLEAALVAYNAGPGNARKWLDADRDYDALPKPKETGPYVKKVMEAYRGAENSTQNGPAQYNGDSKTYLKTVLQKHQGKSHIDNLTGPMADSLAAMINEAPEGLDILSGARSLKHQQRLWDAALKKYGTTAKARKWVAPPGGSRHNHGNATDLGWKGGSFSNAPAEVQKWVHDNAERFGLTFPLGHEPWHIETLDARGKKGKVAEGNLSVSLKEPPSKPADSYFSTSQLDKVNPDARDLDSTLERVRENLVDTPHLIPEAERQVRNEFKKRERVKEQVTDQLVSEIVKNPELNLLDLNPNVIEKMGIDNFNKLLTLQNKMKSSLEASEQAAVVQKVNGLTVQIASGEIEASKMAPEIIQQIGSTNYSKLLVLEEKLNSRADTTDESTLHELNQMTDEEFGEVDLSEYTDRLSKADFKIFSNRQGVLIKDAVDTTDESTLHKLNQMSEEEFGKVNLPDYADRLSKADYKIFSNRQGQLIKGNADTTNEPTLHKLNQMSEEDFLKVDLPKYADRLSKTDYNIFSNRQGKLIREKADKTDELTLHELNQMTDEEFREVDLSEYTDRLSKAEFSKFSTRQGVLLRENTDKTDESVYQRFINMPTEEFLKVPLLEHEKSFSKVDLRQLIDRQAELAKGEGRTNSTSQTRTQLVNEAANILGLSNSKPNDAKTRWALNRALDDRIEQYIAQNNGKEPISTDIGEMLDGLMIEGEVEGTFYNDDAYLFELTPETAADFLYEGATIDSYGDLPENSKPMIAATYSMIFGENPNEDQALDLYNDFGRISLGARPAPPDNIKPRITQGLAIKLGRAPTEEEIAKTYARVLTRADEQFSESK